MPSTPKLLFDLTISVCVLLGGAWLASELSSPAAATEKTQPPEASSLTLTIDGVRNDSGDVIVMVFDKKAAYDTIDYTRSVGFREVRAASGSLNVAFDDLTTGPYAIFLFHDENGDDDLNMEKGLPTEGYGTSGASGMYDEPSFKQALVSPGEVTVQMYYLQ